MLFSKLLIPTLKDAPQEAEVISHKLMLRAGMIRKVASGIYTWLPLGLKVLKKIENIVREEMDSSGAAALSLITGMNHSERRDYALKRIEELRLLIQHWEKNNGSHSKQSLSKTSQ